MAYAGVSYCHLICSLYCMFFSLTSNLIRLGILRSAGKEAWQLPLLESL